MCFLIELLLVITELSYLVTYNLTVSVRAAALLAEQRSSIGADDCVHIAESIRRGCGESNS